ncbi:MAG: hypothetical protein H0V93_00240 [Euzebyales bacterium]|jgi:hypothetical protein|nr:hypothetical protein [Euzebyales bacterium]
MANTVVADRKATLAEVLAHADAIRRLITAHNLGAPRIRGDGTVVVHSDESGYRSVNRLSTEASRVVGAYVHVLTDDVPGAADTQPL